MPLVDLSMIGIEAQQAYATKLATQAQARSSQATAEQTELENQQKIQDEELEQGASQAIRDAAMGRSVPGSPYSPEDEASVTSAADNIMIAAQYAATHGAPSKATELMAKAATIRKQEAEIESGRITDETHRLDNIIKLADAAGRWLGTAGNQAEWDFGLDEMERAGAPPEYVARLRATPWNQNMSAKMAEMSMAYKDKATLDLQTQRDESMELHRARTAATAERRTRIAEEAQRAATIRARAQEKAAGAKAGSASTPNSTEIAAATNAVSVAFFGGKAPKKGTAEQGAMGADAAARAKAILAANPVITYEQALQQAITQMRVDGTYSTELVDNPYWGTGDSEVGKYTPGNTPETARSLPEAGVKGMVKGKYYVTSKGIVQWNGQRGIPIPPKAAE